jgi:hypothetical protein
MSVSVLCILMNCCDSAGVREVFFKKFFDLFPRFLGILFSVPTENTTVVGAGLAAAARGA